MEDIDYPQVRRLEKRALEAETWCTLLTGILDSGKDKEAMCAGYDAFFRGARQLCKDFSDVFPAGTIGSESTSIAPDDGKIYYGGPRPPVSRVEQFASKLLELIDVIASVFVAGDDVVSIILVWFAIICRFGVKLLISFCEVSRQLLMECFLY